MIQKALKDVNSCHGCWRKAEHYTQRRLKSAELPHGDAQVSWFRLILLILDQFRSFSTKIGGIAISDLSSLSCCVLSHQTLHSQHNGDVWTPFNGAPVALLKPPLESAAWNNPSWLIGNSPSKGWRSLTCSGVSPAYLYERHHRTPRPPIAPGLAGLFYLPNADWGSRDLLPRRAPSSASAWTEINFTFPPRLLFHSERLEWPWRRLTVSRNTAIEL